jgi:hypothetical protein
MVSLQSKHAYANVYQCSNIIPMTSSKKIKGTNSKLSCSNENTTDNIQQRFEASIVVQWCLHWQ